MDLEIPTLAGRVYQLVNSMIQESTFFRTNYLIKNPLEWNPGTFIYTYHLMLPKKVADTASQLLTSHSQIPSLLPTSQTKDEKSDTQTLRLFTSGQ